jgi:hypothetical protein
MLVCVLLSACPMSLAVAPHKPPTTFVADWVRTKCGTNGRQLWKYHGALYDPLDGRRIATVEGLEMVSLFSANETQGLQIPSLLNHPNATYEQAATVWSRNIFCYTQGDDNTNSLLREIRVRPQSPRKMIPLDQAVAVYETATTYIGRTIDDFIVHSEWPSGKTLWGPTTSQRDDDSNTNTLSFTVYTKRRSKKSLLFKPDLQKQRPSPNNNEAVIQPERSSLIQFGASNMESKHRFGARETYSMSLPKVVAPKKWWQLQLPLPGKQDDTPAKPQLKYTRYGEGPPFYAPGRMCMLELKAEPIDRLEEASPVLIDLLQQKRVQGWDDTTTTSSSSFQDSQLRLVPEAIPDHDKWAQRKHQVLAAWERLRSAASLQGATN